METAKSVWGSTRFQMLIVAAIFMALESFGIITAQVSVPIITVLLGSIGVRTVDRFGDNLKK